MVLERPIERHMKERAGRERGSEEETEGDRAL
jgi:hypothetical protein